MNHTENADCSKQESRLLPEIMAIMDRLEEPDETTDADRRNLLTQATLAACREAGMDRSPDQIQCAVDEHLLEIKGQNFLCANRELRPNQSKQDLTTSHPPNHTSGVDSVETRARSAKTNGQRLWTRWVWSSRADRLIWMWQATRAEKEINKLKLRARLNVLLPGFILSILIGATGAAWLTTAFGLVSAFAFFCVWEVIFLYSREIIIGARRRWPDLSRPAREVTHSHLIRWSGVPPCRAYVAQCLTSDDPVLRQGDVARLTELEEGWKAERARVFDQEKLEAAASELAAKQAKIHALFLTPLPTETKSRRQALRQLQKTLSGDQDVDHPLAS